MIEAPESQAISHYLLAPPQTRDTLLAISRGANTAQLTNQLAPPRPLTRGTALSW
jgi:hypothetical protein